MDCVVAHPLAATADANSTWARRIPRDRGSIPPAYRSEREAAF
jgi:hypothetical protein